MRTWTKHFDKVEDAYTLGDIMPPVFGEWRRYDKNYYWKVEVKSDGEKPRLFAPIETDLRPIIKGNVVGIAIGHGTSNAKWMFIPFSELFITKYMGAVEYRMSSYDTEGLGVTIVYRMLDAIVVTDDDRW